MVVTSDSKCVTMTVNADLSEFWVVQADRKGTTEIKPVQQIQEQVKKNLINILKNIQIMRASWGLMTGLNPRKCDYESIYQFKHQQLPKPDLIRVSLVKM